jgi:hypothetical protein
MKRTFTSLLLATLVSATSYVSATPIVTFDEGTGTSGANQNQSVGWQFNVLSSITVNGLSWFDQGANGLFMAHTVGIWDSSGTLLASVLVPAGTGAALDGQFRTVSISDLVLTPGNGYIVGGQNFSSNTERLAANVAQVVDSRISYVDATFSNLNGIFERPTQFSTATTGFYGPSFSVVATSGVSDSGASAALLMIALMGCLSFKKRFAS